MTENKCIKKIISMNFFFIIFFPNKSIFLQIIAALTDSNKKYNKGNNRTNFTKIFSHRCSMLFN